MLLSLLQASLLAALVQLPWLALAFRPLTIMYESSASEDPQLNFTSIKIPDLTPWADEFPRFIKRCHSGAWIWTHLTNYSAEYGGLFAHFREPSEISCGGWGWYFELRGGSMRHLGPDDMTEPAISFYSCELGFDSEIIVREATPSVRFEPRSFLVTGYSNWTLYSEPNYSGPSFCFRSTRIGHHVDYYYEPEPQVPIIRL